MSRKLLVSLALAWSALSLSAGCTVDADFAEQSDTFECQTDADCIAPAFICHPNTSQCVRYLGGPDPPSCIDDDQDGYGVNPDGERDRCDFAEQDLDDTDDTIYPGAPELCDGKDNDGDGSTDTPRACQDHGECNRTRDNENVPSGTLFFCESNVCVLKPANVLAPSCETLVLACVGGAYEPLPTECGGSGGE